MDQKFIKMKKAYIYALVSVIALAVGFSIGYFLQKPKDAIIPPEPEQQEEEPEEPEEPTNNNNNAFQRNNPYKKPVIPVGTDPNLNIDDTLA